MSIIKAIETSARRHYEKELELLENDLVPVYTTDTGEKVVVLYKDRLLRFGF